ncbi:MAG: SDR family oxidoreductase [Burkholderiales bacterium]|nr:MAG: SDR family oxidoreductase [Burkholderiales bacterium]
MRGLKDKAAIVTGAGSGIGRAIAMRLAEEGCLVGIFDLNVAGGADTRDAIAAAGGRAWSYRVDISQASEIADALGQFTAAAGPVDVLVNNAGWDRAMPFLQTDFALWQKIVAINLYGPLHMHHAVLPGMVERRSGKVINVASDAARVGSSGEAVYAACKGGIVAFTKTMAREMARWNIQLNVLCPGPTDTPLLADITGEGESGRKLAEAFRNAVPMRRLGRPEDYPGLVAFLASSDSDYMTGQVISISGGLTMAG